MANPPQTLLELAKASWPKASFDRAVLVIVDAQREYVDGALPLAGIDAAVKDAALVLTSVRRCATPVFHIVQHSPPGRGLFEVNGSHVEILPELTPQGDEPVIAKKLPNAFAGTDLAARIRATGRSDIILVGFMTHMCISATARAALDLGFKTTIVAAATATRDIPDPLGRTALAAETVQKTALAELADRFAMIAANAAALDGAR
ncbi:MAG: isochorismatase family protein [Beijerinckiaceae bacterium]